MLQYRDAMALVLLSVAEAIEKGARNDDAEYRQVRGLPLTKTLIRCKHQLADELKARAQVLLDSRNSRDNR